MADANTDPKRLKADMWKNMASSPFAWSVRPTAARIVSR